MPHVIVAGAGPAGASLAWRLAQCGAEVTLVERQHDFARELRGEWLMPSGLAALEEMGLAAALEAAPRWQPDALALYVDGERVVELPLEPARFEGRPPTAVSQPALLEAIVAAASGRPGFRLLRGATVRELLREGGRTTGGPDRSDDGRLTGEPHLLHDGRVAGARALPGRGGRVVGVRVQTAGGSEELYGDLVVGADGRASRVRRDGGFEARESAPPMDVVWCRLPALPGFRGARAYLGRGHLLLAHHTFGDELQLGWTIAKKRFGELRRRGVGQWVEEMARHVSPDLAAHLREHADAIRHPFLLDVVSDRVTRWSAPGVLLLGDAAHTMSPVGGQGVNLALRDALVAANELEPVLRAGAAPAALDTAAQRVETLRLPEVAAVQRLQSLAARLALTPRWWGAPTRRALRHLLRPRLFAFAFRKATDLGLKATDSRV